MTRKRNRRTHFKKIHTQIHTAWETSRRNYSTCSHVTMTSLEWMKSGGTACTAWQKYFRGQIDTTSLAKTGRENKEGTVAFSVKKSLKCVKLFSGMDDSLVDNLQNRMRGESSNGNIMVRVCTDHPYRLRERKKHSLNNLRKYLKQTWVLLHVFNIPDIL